MTTGQHPDGQVNAVFAALSDPTRRQVLEQLSLVEASTATELASGLPMTRQAVAKHLALLRDANLVETYHSGRETRFRLTPDALDEATAWIAEVGAQWDERLARLQEHLHG